MPPTSTTDDADQPSGPEWAPLAYRLRWLKHVAAHGFAGREAALCALLLDEFDAARGGAAIYAADLAACLDCEPRTVTRLVGALVAEGFLEAVRQNRVRGGYRSAPNLYRPALPAVLKPTLADRRKARKAATTGQDCPAVEPTTGQECLMVGPTAGQECPAVEPTARHVCPDRQTDLSEIDSLSPPSLDDDDGRPGFAVEKDWPDDPVPALRLLDPFEAVPDAVAGAQLEAWRTEGCTWADVLEGVNRTLRRWPDTPVSEPLAYCGPEVQRARDRRMQPPTREPNRKARQAGEQRTRMLDSFAEVHAEKVAEAGRKFPPGRRLRERSGRGRIGTSRGTDPDFPEVTAHFDGHAEPEVVSADELEPVVSEAAA